MSIELSVAIKTVLAYPQRCVACHLCEAACSLQHEGAFQPTKSRIFVHDLVEEALYVPVACFHCADAPCLAYCPTYAISRDQVAGWITIDDSRCIGCKMCLVACPFGVMGFHKEKKVAHNCDLCGGDPQCVRACPYEALEYADMKPLEWMARLDRAERPAAD